MQEEEEKIKGAILKIIKANYEILTPIDKDKIYKILENAGRKSHQSEYLMCDGSSEKFLKMIMDKGHYAVLEFFDIIVRFTSNRGFLSELRTHRLGSYVAESTRYCNYIKDKFGNEITCIGLKTAMDIEAGSDTYWKEEPLYKILHTFEDAWEQAEIHYNKLIKLGCSPQMARHVLPLGLKSEVIVKYNLRQWREIFKLRAHSDAHPNMRELMIPLRNEFAEIMPEIFGDLV